MSLWTKVQHLQGDALRQVQMVYGDNFPIEIRCALASWIEDKPWNEIEPDNPQYDLYAQSLVTSLIEEIENKASSEETFVMRLKLSDAADYFRHNYLHNPQQLVRVVKHCLQTEMRAVQNAENMCQGATTQLQGPPERHLFICQQQEKLKRKTQETEEELRRMQHEQETFVIQYQESTKRQAHINQLSAQPQGQANVELLAKLQKEKEIWEQALRQKLSALSQMRSSLLEKYKDTCVQLDDLQKCVLENELIRWKRGQQLFGNGVVFENNLEQIQEWCEGLAEIIWQNRQQIKRLELLFTQLPLNVPCENDLQALNTQILSLLSSLVVSTFVIEKQPPQVMKTNTRFAATVRLLVGGRLNVHMTPPQVKVTIISEAQANALLKNDKGTISDASGEILNNTGTMEYHQASRQLSVSFRNMQLRKIKRAEKKGTESVMDEKFSLLFQSQFKVGGSEPIYQVWTLSLPVVVIVHGNQEPHAWATVTWDNAFAEPVKGRVPFHVPEKVKWSDVAAALSTKFKAATGRELTEDNLRYLAGKGFRSTQFPADYNNVVLSWSQFCKEPLPERNFTFWEWFYAIMKVTKEHLRGLWNDDLIMGFVGRRQAEDMLRKMPSGTFLLRFSDSELGGVTIAWVEDRQEGQEILNLQPFTSRDFAIRSLADRVNDVQNLVYLYPDRLKDQVFSKYYTPFTENPSPSSNGYVRPVLVTRIPGLFGPNSMDSYPSTPVMHPQSPDPNYNDSMNNSMADQALSLG